MTAITLSIESGPDYQRDADGWEHNAYTVKLSRDDVSIEVPWRQGLGITDDPDAASVLDALLMDAAGYLNAQDFEDWASEYGYDTDSRKAFATFEAVEAQTEMLRDLLGDDFDEAVFPTGDEDSEAVARRLAGVSAEVDC